MSETEEVDKASESETKDVELNIQSDAAIGSDNTEIEIEDEPQPTKQSRSISYINLVPKACCPTIDGGSRYLSKPNIYFHTSHAELHELY
jgi:hypothetical protein